MGRCASGGFCWGLVLGFGFGVWGLGFVCDAGWFAGVCAGIRELLARFTRCRSVFSAFELASAMR